MNRYEWRDVAEPSFREPIDDPGTSPIVGPFVCIAINAEWRSILAGCALQVAQPASWTETDPELLADLLSRATLLVESIATAEVCVPVQQRFQDCTLQTSYDGGVTWAAVPGWVENWASCVAGIIGPHVGAVVMAPGLTFPPIPVVTPDGSDWVYAP